MDVRADFLECLGPDTSTTVLMLLDDPADLVRVSAVSRSWRRFVIANSFSKKLCLRTCAEVSYFARVMEGSSTEETVEVGSSSAGEWESLEREHRAYSYLSHCFVLTIGTGECIAEAIRASSTDNFPDESIENTLIEADRVHMRPSYWSSQGESDPGVPETLTYRLGSKLCIINEINIRPFEAYFQYGSPIYSSKAVRFRMGHSLSSQKKGEDSVECTDEKFMWTYVSPEFPMAQQNELQTFKLPRPVICIGGIVQVELVGRIQVQEMDNLYYVCVCHVQVVGRPLSPVFDVDIDMASGSSVLKYFPKKRDACISLEVNESSSWHRFGLREKLNHLRSLRGWNHSIFNSLLGVVDSDSEEDDDE
ncbi:F-box protein At4g00755-like [Asparagus officinalis]|nr:F-box protein At4g00755-like [Asparagus officinalis]